MTNGREVFNQSMRYLFYRRHSIVLSLGSAFVFFPALRLSSMFDVDGVRLSFASNCRQDLFLCFDLDENKGQI